MATINAALTITNQYPSLSTVSTALSIDTSTNPFSFLTDAFKSVVGYDQLIQIISKYIAYGLDALEATIKTILISNIKNLLSCSLNPYISDDLLRDGIVFDLKNIDITQMLKTCPLDSDVGQYFYFGCDDMTTVDETKNSEDFNALLWYMANRAMKRETWGNTRGEDDTRPGETEQDTKADGIITLEYTERASKIKDAVGSAMTIQTPYNNNLHVFIGNTQYINTDDYETQLTSLSQDLLTYDEAIADNEAQITAYEEELDSLYEQYVAQEIEDDEYQSEYSAISDEISALEEEIEDTEELKSAKETEYYNVKAEYTSWLSDEDKIYKDITKNYYYKKTLFEFTYDYVMSLKFFDSKVVAAQLINQLTGMLDISLSLSYAQQLIKNEVLKMVQDIVESDDTTVSDCFFTFDNEAYDTLLKQAELVHSGLYGVDGEATSAVQIDAASLLESLNSISSSATQQEIQSTIEGSLYEVSGTISSTSYTDSDKVNFGIQMNFIEKLMTNLAMVITLSVISPKVYLLILINLRTLGQDTNFSLKDFISQFKQLITSLIRAIRDALIQYLVDQLMAVIADLASSVAVKIAVEQSKYYVELLTALIACFKSSSSTEYGFDLDVIQHADIIEETETSTSSGC